MHADDSGEQPVELSQPLDEPGDRDDLAAVVVEELLCVVQPLRGQKDIPAEPFDERAAAEVPDDEADVVADDRAEHRDEDHHGDVHVARACEHRRGNEQRLAGHRHAEVFEKHEPADGQIAVVLELRLQFAEDTGQLAVGHRVGFSLSATAVTL